MIDAQVIPEIVRESGAELLDEWMTAQIESPTLRSDLIEEEELRRQSSDFLRAFREATEEGIPQRLDDPVCQDLVALVRSVTRARVQEGFTATDVATGIFSLKQPLFKRLADKLHDDPQSLIDITRLSNGFLDKLGLYATEVYQESQAEIIKRQQTELLELSTPVIELWEGVMALPLIGTLDSARTQVVMENLLQRLVEMNASIAIIDITGVPTVDTGVARHLIKTVTAARLMGAECLISGVSPAIAQTMVHLGVDLAEIPTKANLSSALAVALRKTGYIITRKPSAEREL